MSEMFVWQQKEEFTEALSHSLGDKLLRILYVLFFCNRGDTYYHSALMSRLAKYSET